MLTLTAKEKDQIRIGDDVLVQVHRARDGSVRLAILAPRELAISSERRRKELTGAADSATSTVIKSA